MGSGRDKRKKAKGSTPGQGTERTAKKTERNAEKAQRRAQRSVEGGEDDLDALLARFKLNDQLQNNVTEDSAAPSARCFASLTPLPDASGLLLFGGEFYDTKTDRMRVFNDLFRYTLEEDSWIQLNIPHGPAPRSSHQAACIKGALYIFGGELTSANQEKFKHYRDLWRLNIIAQTWEQLPVRGGPQGRSGHRMVAHRNTLIIFGGFYDEGKNTKYFHDVWRFTPETLTWADITPAMPGGAAPAPRGGCQLALNEDTLFVFGGHSVTIQDGEETEHVFDDIWALDLAAPKPTICKCRPLIKCRDSQDTQYGPKGTTTLSTSSCKWERVKRQGMAPSARASFGMATHRRRAVLFGGVTDRAGRGDRISSELHSEAYTYNLDSRRWFPLALRLPAEDRSAAREADAAASALKASTSTEERHAAADALHRAATRIQARFRGYAVRKAYLTYRLGGAVSELLYSPATYGIDYGSSAGALPRPRARANPMMAVCGNTLCLLGGVVEVAHTDVTLDDLWTLDLIKLSGWTCRRTNTEGEDAFKDDEWETDDDVDEAGHDGGF